MTFHHAKCESCGDLLFDPDKLIAFTVRGWDRGRKVEVVQLDGDQPWAGIRVICLACIDAFRRAATVIDAMEADPT
jgi:hypothetical protein